jgi:prepilin-type N-terminal cleavage/methylation domain-containing protein
MKRAGRRLVDGYTMIEMIMAMGVLGLVLSGMIAGSITLQRSLAATLDYAVAQNDQARISDYLAVDMRRALTVTPDGTGGVTMTLPNFYNADGTPKTPTVVSTMGWPGKERKKKKNKHTNIILSQTVSYDPVNTVTVNYYKGNASAVGKDTTKFYRETGGVAKAIANGVADFQVAISDDQTIARTSITYAPIFRLLKTYTANPSTTYYQTTLLRNAK